MAERIQKTKAAPQKTATVETIEPTTDQAEDIKAATDELLDEIDALLEENAEEFVAAYVQKGGQ